MVHYFGESGKNEINQNIKGVRGKMKITQIKGVMGENKNNKYL